jgi:hypothetical protein
MYVINIPMHISILSNSLASCIMKVEVECGPQVPKGCQCLLYMIVILKPLFMGCHYHHHLLLLLFKGFGMVNEYLIW